MYQTPAADFLFQFQTSSTRRKEKKRTEKVLLPRNAVMMMHRGNMLIKIQYEYEYILL